MASNRLSDQRRQIHTIESADGQKGYTNCPRLRVKRIRMAAHPSGGEQQEELALALGGSDPDDLAALRQGHEGLRRHPVPSAKASWDSKCHFEKRYPMNRRTDVPGFSGQSSPRDGGLSQSSSALHPLKKLLHLNLLPKKYQYHHFLKLVYYFQQLKLLDYHLHLHKLFYLLQD